MGLGQAGQKDGITDMSIDAEHTEWTEAVSGTSPMLEGMKIRQADRR
jgi:hypothetical protein